MWRALEEKCEKSAKGGEAPYNKMAEKDIHAMLYMGIQFDESKHIHVQKLRTIPTTVQHMQRCVSPTCALAGLSPTMMIHLDTFKNKRKHNIIYWSIPKNTI